MSTLTKHGRNPRILRQRKKISSCAILELELLWRKVKQVLLQPLTWSCNNVNVAGYMCVAAIQSRCTRMMYVVCWMYCWISWCSRFELARVVFPLLMATRKAYSFGVDVQIFCLSSPYEEFAKLAIQWKNEESAMWKPLSLLSIVEQVCITINT